jgi:arsenate reductase
MPEKLSVLFICTGNSCRSQMAEALCRHLAGDRFEARSAGSHPAGYIHELAILAMAEMGISMEGQYSKSWDTYAKERNDVIITVCDSAASETCPFWPGHPASAHWGLPDPSHDPGTDADRLASAMDVAGRLKCWIEAMRELPFEKLSLEEARSELTRIYRT